MKHLEIFVLYVIGHVVAASVAFMVDGAMTSLARVAGYA